MDDPVGYFLWNGGVDGRSSHDEIPFLGWSVFFDEMVDCLASGRKSGEAVGVAEDSTSLPPALDFREAIHHMWPVDAFHRADDVVFVPDFCVSAGDIAEMDGGFGHVGALFPVWVFPVDMTHTAASESLCQPTSRNDHKK